MNASVQRFFPILFFLSSLTVFGQSSGRKFILKSDLTGKEYTISGKDLAIHYKPVGISPGEVVIEWISGDISQVKDNLIYLDADATSKQFKKDGITVENYFNKYIVKREPNIIEVPLTSIGSITPYGTQQHSLKNFSNTLMVLGVTGVLTFSTITFVKNQNVPVYAARGLGFSLLGGIGGALLRVTIEAKEISLAKKGPWRIMPK